MNPSHATRSRTGLLAPFAIGALLLTACGSNAEAPGGDAASAPSSAAGQSPSSSVSSTAAAPTPTPSARSTTGGISDPLTGLRGSAESGRCAWLDVAQARSLVPWAANVTPKGRLLTAGSADLTFRRCLIGIHAANSRVLPVGTVRIGTLTFTSPAALTKFANDMDPRGVTRIPGRTGLAVTVIEASPAELLQHVFVARGATVVDYVSFARRTGSSDVKVVSNRLVPKIDDRPALLALYDQVFG